MLDTGLKLALAPILITQGWRARATAQELQPPIGPLRGAIGEGPDLKVLIVGDSSALGVGVAHQRQGLSGQVVSRLVRAGHRVHWRLNGVCGATTKDTLDRLAEDEPPEDYDIAVTALGVNDITKNVTLKSWLQNSETLWHLLHTRFNCDHILVSGVPPIASFPLLPEPLKSVLHMQGQRWDESLKARTQMHAFTHHVRSAEYLAPEDMSSDGFHPGEPVYAMWADSLLETIDQKSLI